MSDTESKEHLAEDEEHKEPQGPSEAMGLLLLRDLQHMLLSSTGDDVESIQHEIGQVWFFFSWIGQPPSFLKELTVQTI